MTDKDKTNDTTPVNFKLADGMTHTHAGVDYEAGQTIEKMPKFKADRLVAMKKGQIVNG